MVFPDEQASGVHRQVNTEFAGGGTWMANSTPPDQHWFWNLIDSSDRSLRKLCGKLEQLSKHDLCRYYLAYGHWKDAVNPHYREECHPYLAEPCSEDHCDDFSAWVVMQGLAFFDEVIKHPERIQQYLEVFSDCASGHGYSELRWDENVDREDYRGCQRADYIASAIFRSRHGGSILDACYDNRGWPREGF
jgi:hypothetical protein